MPGTPPTSPNFGAPRYSDGDTASFSTQVNSVTDTFDANAVKTTDNRLHQPGDLIESYATTRAGAVLCDGAAYVLSSHPEMSALAAACPGLVSGGTLTVPDLRGRTVIGAGAGPGLTARAVSQTGGEETHVISTAEMPSHSHTPTDPGHAHGFGGYIPVSLNAWFTNTVASGPATGFASWGGAFASYNASSSATTGISIGNTGGGGAHNNMPPYGVANIFIKL